MYSAWNRKKTTLFSRHYLRNHSTSDIGVLDYIGVFLLKEHSPEVWHIPPGTPCILLDLTYQISCLLCAEEESESHRSLKCPETQRFLQEELLRRKMATYDGGNFNRWDA